MDFGSLIDRLQGFFSKGFFLAGLYPAVLFLFINGLMAYLIIPGARSLIDPLFNPEGINGILAWSGIVLLALVVGMILFSLNAWFRQLLEGKYLPRFMENFLCAAQNEMLEAKQSYINSIEDELLVYRLAAREPPTWVDQLAEARRAGQAAANPSNGIFYDLEEKISSLEKNYNFDNYISAKEIKQVFDQLKQALISYSANKYNKLDQLQTRFTNLWMKEHSYLEQSYQRNTTERNLRFPPEPGQVGPTRLANLEAAHREYGLNRYGFDIELLWLRVLRFVREDSNFYPIVEEAKNQLDFTVAIAGSLLLFCVLWIPLTMLLAPTPLPFILIMVLGPLSVLLFNELVVQNYRAFTEAVRTAVDLYRFPLLSALHISLPQDQDEEKGIWRALQEWPTSASASSISYHHGSPSAAEEALEKLGKYLDKLGGP